MQIPLIHQQILLQTERLRDLHRLIMMHSSTIPAAEMNNLLLEIRNLYSLALQLNNENDLQLLNELQIASKSNIRQPEPVSTQPDMENSNALVYAVETIKEKIIETKVTENPQPIASKPEENQSEKKRLVSEIHEMFQDAPTLANRFSDHKTVAEKIGIQNGTKRISENLKTSVRDIKSAIGLNEKFLFINQLFNGDSVKYNSVIDELNSCTSAESALNSVKTISDSNNWESHAAAAKLFIDIVERRFTV